MLRRPLSWAVMTSIVLLAAPARSDDCTPATGQSTCFDADSLWLRATSDRFVTVDRAHIRDPGSIVVAGATTYAARPVVAVAPSPDPEGREIDVVSDVLGVTLLAACTPFRNAEFDVAVPFVLFQDGNGLAGVTTRGASDLRSTTFRDPRVGFAYGLPFSRDTVRGAIKASLDLAFPLGDEDHFAGDAGPVVAPALTAEADVDRFFAGITLGARLRRTVSFSSAQLGSELDLSLGAGLHALGDGLLSTGAEVVARPRLSSQDHGTPAGETVEAVLIPAEWALFVRTEPWGEVGPALRIAGGTALPLSHRRIATADGEERTETFAGVTSPIFRLVLSVHYAFDGD